MMKNMKNTNEIEKIMRMTKTGHEREKASFQRVIAKEESWEKRTQLEEKWFEKEH